ncbi:hypothetical protein LOAG_03785 [Loa loa]|uniref:Uncharacterized protein n=1 Tax=Loa loa TaxID=7209 RepID=A0A1S0U4F1_LOALO|nr:hypothetical protein LOAG_03785 [Loa loa]EFO24703.1 hypothetical protein LOAG_03785 [Loa loa]
MKLRSNLETKERMAEILVKKKKGRQSPSITKIKKIITDEKCWNTASYEEQERKISELQNDMLIQRDYYQKELEESCDEKERLNMELLKVDEKISILEKATKRLENENAKYLTIIQEMRQNSAKQLEEEAAKMKQSMKMKQMIKEELYQSSKGMEARLELMLKQICDDNVKLHEHLWKIEETYGNGKVKRIEREKFQQELKKKLNDLLRKFKIEAISSNLKWSNDETIQYAIDNFEATIEIILQDKPSFHSLAERLSVFIEAKNKRNNEQLQLSKYDNAKKSTKGQESEAFALFKERFRQKIHVMLAKFMEKQKNEFSENISTIINHVGDLDKRVDASLTSRIENMSDIITHIDRKKSNLHKIEEDLDYSIVLVKSLFDQRQVELERKEKSDRPNFDEESYKLREKYSQISHRYTKLEERMENIEKQYEELLYAKLDRDEQMYDIKSRHRKKVTSMS